MSRKPLRADAAARREDILNAAEDIFAQHGPQASLDLICKAADVGRATLYRNFSSRNAIFEAIFKRNIEQLEYDGRVQDGSPDALFVLFEHIADIQVKTGAVYSFQKQKGDFDQELHERFRKVLDTCIRSAIAGGRVAGGLSAETVQLSIDMLAGGFRDRSYQDRLRIRNEALSLCLHGLCADAPANA